jgi:Mg-chelatase subunit ChlD
VVARGKGGTVAQTLVERAFDLNAAGLEVAICIDSTGSMQVAIDHARDAVEDLVSLLKGIAPKFRLGLVHYKDVTDFSAGAEIRVPLTPNVTAVHDSLADLRAGGGGDTPEAVEKGLEQALLPAMGWQKTTNKLVVIVGDAPPHPENIPIAVDLARNAHERPFQRKNAPTTGKEKSNVRPFVISALALNSGPVAAFREITDAGGGMCVSLAPQGARRGQAEERAAAASKGTKAFVKQVLVLSFGSQWREPMDEFVEIYFAYRDAGVFR